MPQSSEKSENNPQCLAGVRVLDLSRVLAGPFCTMLLADLGAEVIKIEDPDGGDETRHWGPPWQGEGEDRKSAYFLSVNRNKKSVGVNLKTPEGREIVRRLASRSHVLIENFKPGTMEKFQLEYAQLEPLNPALVYCSITGFGQEGPYRRRPGYDVVIQAMSGLMSITGPPEGPAFKVGVAVSDVLTGLFAAASILSALRHAEQSGEGQYLDLALFDCQVAALVNVTSNYLVSGSPPGRFGNQHPNIVPYQVFSASDADFMLAVGNDRQFERLCRVLERPDLALDERFRRNADRVLNRGDLIAILEDEFRDQPLAHWIKELLQAGVPAGPINDIPSVLADPQLKARHLFWEQDDYRQIGFAAKLSKTPAQLASLPPGLGQHTKPVLEELLQMTRDQIGELRAAGVISK